MNTLVAHTLHHLLRLDRTAAPSALRVAARGDAFVQSADVDWAVDTRPVIFRSEAFAEDLDELLLAA